MPGIGSAASTLEPAAPRARVSLPVPAARSSTRAGAPNPSSPWPKFVNKSYTRAIDFVTPASRVERVRVQGENPPHGGGQQPIVGEQPVNQTIIVTNPNGDSGQLSNAFHYNWPDVPCGQSRHRGTRH